MPATTYAISATEEPARRFEAAAAAQDMEPSEVLCKLVREFAEAGGFDNKAAQEAAEMDALEQQASEWLTLRAAHERQRMEDAQRAAEMEDARPKTRTPLPWEDPAEVLPWQQETTNPDPKLPWND